MGNQITVYSTVKEKCFFQKREPVLFMTEREDYEEREEKGGFDPTMKMSVKDSQAINVYPEVEYQTILGFGGAMTESAAINLQKMDARTREEVLEKYFSKEGLGYHFCRISINSSDFSEAPYDYIEPLDAALSSFSLEHEENTVFKMIRCAENTSGTELDVIATPWSPPAWMKTNSCRCNGGKLKPEYYSVWAEYFVKYVQEARKRGIPVTTISIQNEPLAYVSWDSCIYSAQEERDFLKKYLYPALEAAGLSDIKIMIWDHNKDKMVERVRTIMEDAEAASHVWGVAFHWYAGDHFEALDIVHQMYPELTMIYTEGCNGGVYRKTGEWCSGERIAHEIFGDLNHWTSACIDWNLVLDEQGGPTYAENYCDAPIIYDTVRGKYILESSYYYIGHFSKYVQRGAKRIAFSAFSDTMDVSAFKNPDGQIVVVVMNREDEDRDICLRCDGQLASLKLEAHSIHTLLF